MNNPEGACAERARPLHWLASYFGASMDPITGGLLVGGANLLSNIFSTTQNNQNAQQMQQQAESFDQSMVQQQENYETQMSNTAYQRAQADMKAAGLNPIAMANSGASTPSISAPTISPAAKSSALGGVGSAIQSGVSTAMGLKSANASVDNMIQQNRNLQAQNNLIHSQAMNTEVDSELKQTQNDATKARTNLVNQAVQIGLSDAAKAKNTADFHNSATGRVLDILGAGGKALSDTVAPVGQIVGTAKQAGSILKDRNDIIYGTP